MRKSNDNSENEEVNLKNQLNEQIKSEEESVDDEINNFYTSEEYEEEKRRERISLLERLGRVREPHLRRKMVLSEPCIPWEYGSNKYESQKGMNAFGQSRDTTIKVHSTKSLTNSNPSIVPRFSRASSVTQAGQSPFGAIRDQVTRVIEHEGESKKRCQEILTDPKQTERILPLWSKPETEGKYRNLQFGSKRQVIVKSIGGRNWTKKELLESKAALPRLCRVDETSAAKDNRNAIKVMSTGYVPLRQITTQISGMERTEKDQLESNKYLNWLGGKLLLQTQSKTGGFQKPRDVVSTNYYTKEINKRKKV
ncbi:hypothetical protein Mgra_00003403 [Meloidogyne graminicola]|uniref:Uncharacterized protein n=1 Tax=Meloidogyne graminicola TaxID=189291 RepID=A0A8S9ZVQ0_9BILA|nr:hypothetical protein Mgra_00003403 [Meloidogyne graminicola]